MNKKPAVLTLSIGIACALLTVVFALDLGGISTLLPEAYKAVWGFGGCAAALLVCGAFALAHKPTKTELIEQDDERNKAINGKAALLAFEVFSILVPLAGLVLYIVGEVSRGRAARAHRRGNPWPPSSTSRRSGASRRRCKRTRRRALAHGILRLRCRLRGSPLRSASRCSGFNSPLDC